MEEFIVKVKRVCISERTYLFRFPAGSVPDRVNAEYWAKRFAEDVAHGVEYQGMDNLGGSDDISVEVVG